MKSETGVMGQGPGEHSVRSKTGVGGQGPRVHSVRSKTGVGGGQTPRLHPNSEE